MLGHVVCMRGHVHVHLQHLPMHACIHACMYTCVHVCSACMCTCTHVCAHVHACIQSTHAKHAWDALHTQTPRQFCFVLLAVCMMTSCIAQNEHYNIIILLCMMRIHHTQLLLKFILHSFALCMTWSCIARMRFVT